MIRVYASKIVDFSGVGTVQLAGKLSARGLRRADTMRSAAGRNATITAELLLQKVARERIGRRIELSEGSFGKPFAKDLPDIHFNLSHSGEYAVCAVGDSPVGVDIQQIVPLKADIASRFFSSQEQAYVRGAGRREAFFDIWVLKEAYVKYTGKGFTEAIDGFSTVLPPGDDAILDGKAGIQTGEAKTDGIFLTDGTVFAITVDGRPIDGLNLFKTEFDGYVVGVCSMDEIEEKIHFVDVICGAWND